MSNIITGDVLVARSPCVQPSDIQKVTAVNKPCFAQMFDVLICSSQGDVPLLSLLSNGDYDLR